MTTARPAYRKPWEHGARAYHEADTFPALVEGAKHKRDAFVVHMPLSAVAGVECGVCHIPLDQPYPVNPGEARTRTDSHATVTYYPRTHGYTAAHLYCGWEALMLRIIG